MINNFEVYTANFVPVLIFPTCILLFRVIVNMLHQACLLYYKLF